MFMQKEEQKDTVNFVFYFLLIILQSQLASVPAIFVAVALLKGDKISQIQKEVTEKRGSNKKRRDLDHC